MIVRNAFSRLVAPLLLALALACGCSPNLGDAPVTTNEPSEVTARQSLIRFFHALKQGDYETAVNLYGGSFETMVEDNPSMDPNDHGGLFEAACTMNGAQCLDVRSALKDPAEAGTGGAYFFLVEFNQADGSRFSLGPCCGDNSAGAAAQTQFRFEVREMDDHQFRVVTPPVYMP